MLTIYLDKESIENRNKEIIEMNDMYFNRNVTDSLIKNAPKDYIRIIDNSKYIGDLKIKSRFTDTQESVAKLSTGCKTIYNTIYYANKNDKVINTVECGYNALTEIVELKDGNIYMPIIGIMDLPNKVKIIKNNKEFITSDIADLWKAKEEDE